ncbi:hypothetical protein ACA910_013401 [Epithemia clementina (nom. ined.)]
MSALDVLTTWIKEFTTQSSFAKRVAVLLNNPVKITQALGQLLRQQMTLLACRDSSPSKRKAYEASFSLTADAGDNMAPFEEPSAKRQQSEGDIPPSSHRGYFRGQKIWWAPDLSNESGKTTLAELTRAQMALFKPHEPTKVGHIEKAAKNDDAKVPVELWNE